MTKLWMPTVLTGRLPTRVGAPAKLACLCLLVAAAASAQQAKQKQELRTVLPYWVTPGQRVSVQVFGQASVGSALAT